MGWLALAAVEVEAVSGVDDDGPARPSVQRAQRPPRDESRDRGVDVHDVVPARRDYLSNPSGGAEQVRKREGIATPRDVEALVEVRSDDLVCGRAIAERVDAPALAAEVVSERSEEDLEGDGDGGDEEGGGPTGQDFLPW